MNRTQLHYTINFYTPQQIDTYKLYAYKTKKEHIEQKYFSIYIARITASAIYCVAAYLTAIQSVACWLAFLTFSLTLAFSLSLLSAHRSNLYAYKYVECIIVIKILLKIRTIRINFGVFILIKMKIELTRCMYMIWLLYVFFFVCFVIFQYIGFCPTHYNHYKQ